MPTLLTPQAKEEAKQAVISSLEQSPKLTMRNAAVLAGVSHVSLYKWMQEDKGFAERLLKARNIAQQAATDHVEETLYDRATDPEDNQGVKAAEIILKAHRKKLYGEDERKFKQTHHSQTVVNIAHAEIHMAEQASDAAHELATSDTLEIEGETTP